MNFKVSQQIILCVCDFCKNSLPPHLVSLLPWNLYGKFAVMTSDAKDKIQYGTAVAMLASGMVLTFCSFFMLGDVLDGVLWYTGQTMVYAGSIFGITMFIRTKSGEIKSYIDDRLGVRKDSQEE